MQPSILFYQLDTDSQSDINHLLCELCYKFYQNKRNIYILCPNQDYCDQLDEYIINYQASNFFPYQLIPDGPIPYAPVCLGTDATTKLKYDILINLHTIIPDNFVKYREVIELVSKDEQAREISRQHYKHYQKLLYKIKLEHDYEQHAR